MIKKCMGCGAVLQSENSNMPGYINHSAPDSSVYCERCFKIKNYGEYKVLDTNSKDYEIIFNEVSNKNDLVLYLCDILNLDDSILNVNKIKGPVVLVITKMDLLPKSVKEYKIINYIKNNYDINVKDIICVCGKKNYNLDLLVSCMNKYKTSKNIYLMGNTNAGKSTLINSLLKMDSNLEFDITTSILPATTLDIIKIKFKDFTLIDTPGLVSDTSFLFGEKPKVIKNISPNKEIKPITIQIKPNQSILIGNYARIDYVSNTPNSITIYVSNSVEVSRINSRTNKRLNDLNKTYFDLKDGKDIVISGLCFIKITKCAKIYVHVKNNVNVFERNNLI